MKYTKKALFVFVLLAFMYGYYFQSPGVNGNSRLGLVFAMIQQRRLAIDSFYTAEGTITFDFALVNGHYYTDKAIGTSVIGAIFYAPIYLFIKLANLQVDLRVIKYILTFLVIGIPSAFAGSLVYVLCETLCRSSLRAYLVTLAITLGTMVLPFSAIYFGHQLAGALLFCSFFLIFQLKLKPELASKGWYLFLIGLLLGTAFITEYTTAIVIFPLGLYYLSLLRDRLSWRWFRSVILPVVYGAIIPLGILMAYDSLVFGNPFAIGYEHLGNEFAAGMSQGFLGISRPNLEVLFYLTFHPAEGIFWQSPVLLMAMVGFYFLWREKRFRLEAILVAIAFIGYLLLNSGYFVWWGGASFGPRHIIPMLLFLSIPLAMLPKRFAPLVIILALISFTQMLIPLAGSVLVPDEYFSQTPHLPFFGYSTIYSYGIPQLVEGHFSYNLGEIILGLQNWLTVVPYILIFLLASCIFIFYNLRTSRNNLLAQPDVPVK